MVNDLAVVNMAPVRDKTQFCKNSITEHDSMSSIPFIDEIVSRLATNKRVHRELPFGGRLYLDRRLPFICVYRRPAGLENEAAERLISTQASYLIFPDEKLSRRFSVELLSAIAKNQKEHFAGFLILEVWLSQEPASQENTTLLAGNSRELKIPAPWFCVHADQKRGPAEAVASLIQSLRQVRAHRQLAEVALNNTTKIGPPGHPQILTWTEMQKIGCHLLGLEVRPVYEDSVRKEVFPTVLHSLRRSLDRVFKKTFFAYARANTNINPRHFHALGRRSFVKSVLEADQQLAQIERSFDMLLLVTPTNVESSWLEFRKKKYNLAPRFQYRPVAVEPTALKRQLFQVPIERIEDVTLAHLLREKQDELDRKLTMINDVGTSNFLFGSRQIYGGVSPKLADLASDVLRLTSARSRKKSSRKKYDAETFAGLAQEEIQRYQKLDPTFTPRVEVRDDIFSGLLVSQGKLLIGKQLSVPAHRAEALLQHEIGTHLITYHNGNSQPFKQLSLGLAGYDTLQEGVAVLAEYLVGGLERERLRLLAARVLAVKALLDGADFVETFRFLTKNLGFTKRTAYTITMRVYRGGGMTKDAAYLQGLSEILAYLGRGGKIEPLFIGKIAADHIPLVEELRLRQVLSPPPLRPRYLDSAHYAQSIAQVRSGLGVLDLINEMECEP